MTVPMGDATAGRPAERPPPSSRRRLVAFVIGAGLIGGAVAWALQQHQLLEAVRRLSPLMLAALLALSATALVAQALRFRVAARVFGAPIGIRESLELTLVNGMAQLWAPARTGLLVRAAYLRATHGISLARYGALTITAELVLFFVAALLGAGCALAGRPSHPVIGALFCLAVFAVGGVYVACDRLAIAGRNLPRLGERLNDFRTGLVVWRRHLREARRLAAWSTLVVTLHGLRLAASFTAIGTAVSLTDVMIIQAAVALSIFIAVTPGGLGMKEGVVVGVAAALGIDVGVAVVASLIDRAVSVLELVVGGLVAMPMLTRRTVHASG
jgi:uncharacterized membrane protein YbhN (UPF0104 family)